MDQSALQALQNSINAFIAAKPPNSPSWPPPGITQLSPPVLFNP
jgi:hypothetical protein